MDDFYSDVEVIIPTFNAQKYLIEAIDSVLGQDYKSIFITILDGGSTDLTEAICRGYEKKSDKFKFHVFPKSHPAHRLNEYIKSSLGRSKYIAFMHGDDVCTPSRISHQVEFMRKNSELVMAGSATHFFLHDKMEPGRLQYSGIQNYPEGSENIKLRLPFFWCFSLPSILVRRSLFSDSGCYFDEGIEYCSDYDWYYRISRRYALDNSNEVLLSYRHHIASDGVANRIFLDPELKKIFRRVRQKEFSFLNPSELDVLGEVQFEPETTLVAKRGELGDVLKVMKKIEYFRPEYRRLMYEYKQRLEKKRYLEIVSGGGGIPVRDQGIVELFLKLLSLIVGGRIAWFFGRKMLGKMTI